MHTDQPTCGQLFPELPRGKENRLISNSHCAESGAENSRSNLENRIITVEKQQIPSGGWREGGEKLPRSKTEQRGERSVHTI